MDEAFVPGREGAARQTLFNRISSNYDEVMLLFVAASCAVHGLARKPHLIHGTMRSSTTCSAWGSTGCGSRWP